MKEPKKLGGKFLEVSIVIDGFVEMRRGLLGIDKATEDLTSAWENIAKDFWKEQKQIFKAEGAFDGRSKWQELSPAYKEWKALKYPGQPILVATGDLKDSLTGQNPGSVYKVEPMGMEIGTEIPYAIYHQSREPRKKIPRRPFLDTSPNQRKRWMSIIQRAIQTNINLKLAQAKPTKRERI